MARDRSGSSVTGKPAPPPHRWVPMSRTRPWRACAGTLKVCGHPSAPCASASARRPCLAGRSAQPPARRCSGAAACRFASPLHRGPPAPGSVGLGLSPPVPARRSAAAPAPRSPRYALRAARTAPALGPTARPWAAPGGPDGPPYAPLRVRLRPFCAGASAGPPRAAPPAPCLRSSLAQLVALGGLRAPLLPPGAWSGPAGRFLRPPAPGV